MPQLDISSYSSQLFWLIATFSLLYFFVARYALPEIGRVLRYRHDRIQTDIEQAQNLKNEAAALKAQYEAGLKKTKDKANETIAQATQLAADKARDRHMDLDEVLAQKLSASEKNIKELEKKAVAAFVPVSAELSARIVKKLTGISVKPEKASAAVNKLLKG